MDSVRAVLEVKTRPTTRTLKESLEHLNSLPIEIAAPIFKGIFAFETAIPDGKPLGHTAKFYEDSMTSWAQPFDEVTAICVLKRQLVLSGYADDPIPPVSLLVRNLMGRNFQTAVSLDAMQNYLRTPAPRAVPEGLPWCSRVELGGKLHDYLEGIWQVTMEETDSDDEGGASKRALTPIALNGRWLANGDPW